MSMYGAESRRPVHVPVGDGRTKGSMAAECDVNLIVARYRRSGALEHLARGVPQYADVSEVGDYRTALENARAAEGFFSRLPAKLREAFNNDAAEYLAALQDPAAQEKLEKLADEVYPSRRAPRAPVEPERAPEAPAEPAPEPA